MKILFQQIRSLIQKVSHRKDLYDKQLLIVVIFIILLGPDFSNHIEETFGYNSWELCLNLYRFDFLLLLIALRDKVKKLISSYGYRIIIYLLVNHFADRYFDIKSWSWNDTLTVAAIAFEYIFEKLKVYYRK